MPITVWCLTLIVDGPKWAGRNGRETRNGLVFVNQVLFRDQRHILCAHRGEGAFQRAVEVDCPAKWQPDRHIKA
jgi:hypothetical protein